MARKYYYDTGEQKIGPVDGEELLRLRATGALADDTWVRRADSATWRPLSSVDLRAEEEEAASPSLLKALLRNMSVPSIILGAAVLVVAVAMGVFLIGALWPLLLVFGLVWLMMSGLKNS